jgi:hypothetical protein
MEELKEKATSKTKLIFINNPNNPTGAVLDKSELKAICEIAEDCGAYVLSDEIYRGLEWEGDLTPAALNYSEKAISTASLSKTLGLTGIRVGWLATRDKAIMDRCFAIHRYGTMSCNLLGEKIAYAALEPRKYNEILNGGKEMGKKNLETIDKWISKSKVWSWVKPRGGYLSFLKYELPIGSWELCERLINEPYMTSLVPGVGYGERFNHYVRLGLSGEPEVLQQVLRQIDKFTDDLHK